MSRVFLTHDCLSQSRHALPSGLPRVGESDEVMKDHALDIDPLRDPTTHLESPVETPRPHHVYGGYSLAGGDASRSWSRGIEFQDATGDDSKTRCSHGSKSTHVDTGVL